MDFWKGKNVLVTGGTGFVGSHLVERLLEEKAHVTATTYHSESSGKLKDIHHTNLSLFAGDLKNYNLCLMATKDKDVVMNLAALVGGVQYNLAHPATLFKENLGTFLNVIESSRQNNVDRFLVVSSACVYPRDSSVPTPETEGFKDWPEPTNEGYGMSKRMQEYLGMKYAHEYGMKVAIARPFNTYGPRDKFDQKMSHVIPGLIRRVFEGENPLKVWGSGKQTRSFIYVSDFVEGLMLTAEKYCAADPLNIGTSEEVTVKHLIESIVEIAGTKTKIEFDITKAEGQPRRTCDTTKALEKIGFKAKIGLREGLEKTIEWYLKNGKA